MSIHTETSSSGGSASRRASVTSTCVAATAGSGLSARATAVRPDEAGAGRVATAGRDVRGGGVRDGERRRSKGRSTRLSMGGWRRRGGSASATGATWTWTRSSGSSVSSSDDATSGRSAPHPTPRVTCIPHPGHGATRRSTASGGAGSRSRRKRLRDGSDRPARAHPPVVTNTPTSGSADDAETTVAAPKIAISERMPRESMLRPRVRVTLERASV